MDHSSQECTPVLLILSFTTSQFSARGHFARLMSCGHRDDDTAQQFRIRNGRRLPSLGYGRSFPSCRRKQSALRLTVATTQTAERAAPHLEYLELVDVETLKPAETLFLRPWPRPAPAAYLGATRLIDNVVLQRSEEPMSPAESLRTEARTSFRWWQRLRGSACCNPPICADPMHNLVEDAPPFALIEIKN